MEPNQPNDPTETTDLVPFLLRNLRADLKGDIATLRAEMNARFEHVYKELDRRVTHEEFHDAMRSLNQSLARTHARVVDNDIRMMSVQREIQGSLASIHQYLDARGGLEDRVRVCEDDIADLKHSRH